MRIGTLNIGALGGKEDILRGLECDVCALQETVVPRHKRASISAYIRQLGGSIVYSEINPDDECQRGQHKGVRLGSGLACVAFSPWKITPLPHPLPDTPAWRKCRYRVLPCLASNGVVQVHAVYSCPYNRQNVFGDICEVLTLGVREYPLAHHVIMGDWQCVVAQEAFGTVLRNLGWLAHSDFLDDRPTNRPFRGEARRIDEIFLCASLGKLVCGVSQETVIGASTHDVLRLELRFEEVKVCGTKLAFGLSAEEIEAMTADVADEVWDAPWNTQAGPTELYQEWMARLHAWCYAKEGVFGVGQVRPVEDQCDGRSPVKPRSLFRQNIAKKMSSHFGELRQLLSRVPWSHNQQTRAQQLLAALSRGPWDAWGEILGDLHIPADFSGIIHLDAQTWVTWADSFWEEIYVRILEQARHGLSLWKLRMKDSANGAGLKDVSRWLKGQGGVPVLKNEDGTFTAHPHLRRGDSC